MNIKPFCNTVQSGVPPPRQFEVHISGGRRINLKVVADDFEDVARRITRDRFLIGVFDASESDHVVERTILIPASRIDYVVDIDD